MYLHKRRNDTPAPGDIKVTTQPPAVNPYSINANNTTNNNNYIQNPTPVDHNTNSNNNNQTMPDLAAAVRKNGLAAAAKAYDQRKVVAEAEKRRGQSLRDQMPDDLKNLFDRLSPEGNHQISYKNISKPRKNFVKIKISIL